jgi:hypothetical protein
VSVEEDIGAILVVSLLTPFGGTVSAYRWSNSLSCTPWNDVNWRFGVTTGASSTDLNAFRDGANNWNTLKGASNNQFLFSDEVTSGANLIVNWAFMDGPDTDCTTSTTTRYITMDDTRSASYNTYAGAHEIGHTFGMRHTGKTGNLSPDGAPTFPVMGCGPLAEGVLEPQVPRADDVAQAFARVGPRATPNWGFENGTSWWALGGGATLVSTTVYQGTRAVNLPLGGAIRTRIRKAEPGNHRPDACPHINTFTEGVTVQYPVDIDSPVLSSLSWLSFTSSSFTVSGGSDAAAAAPHRIAGPTPNTMNANHARYATIGVSTSATANAAPRRPSRSALATNAPPRPSSTPSSTRARSIGMLSSVTVPRSRVSHVQRLLRCCVL